MITSIWNVKGGVGKTLTSINLAAGFAKEGKKTLLVDMDGQSSVSYLLFPERDVESIIENNSANFIYLYGKDMDTIKRISAMSGKKLVWKSDKGSYEEAPVISTDQLQQLSMGDAVIISARKKAYIFRMRNYKKYSFYKNKKKYVPGETRRLRNVRVYNVQEYYDADQKISDAFDSKKDLLSGDPQLSAELKTGVEQLQEKQSLIPTAGFGLGAAK